MFPSPRVLGAAFFAVSLRLTALVAAQQRGAAPAPTGPLTPFGATEARVRTLLVGSVSGGGEIANELLVLIQEGYQRVPVATRGPATTAAFAWAKAYINSTAFATEYAKARDEHKPVGGVTSDSIDGEVQKTIAKQIADLEESKRNMAMLDA